MDPSIGFSSQRLEIRLCVHNSYYGLEQLIGESTLLLDMYFPFTSWTKLIKLRILERYPCSLTITPGGY
jgi:hypothetical protein